MLNDHGKHQSSSRTKSDVAKAADVEREETVEAFGAGALGGIALGAVLSTTLGPTPLFAAIVGSALGGLIGGAAGVGVNVFTEDSKKARK